MVELCCGAVTARAQPLQKDLQQKPERHPAAKLRGSSVLTGRAIERRPDRGLEMTNRLSAIASIFLALLPLAAVVGVSPLGHALTAIVQ